MSVRRKILMLKKLKNLRKSLKVFSLTSLRLLNLKRVKWGYIKKRLSYQLSGLSGSYFNLYKMSPNLVLYDYLFSRKIKAENCVFDNRDFRRNRLLKKNYKSNNFFQPLGALLARGDESFYKEIYLTRIKTLFLLRFSLLNSDSFFRLGKKGHRSRSTALVYLKRSFSLKSFKRSFTHNALSKHLLLPRLKTLKIRVQRVRFRLQRGLFSTSNFLSLPEDHQKDIEEFYKLFNQSRTSLFKQFSEKGKDLFSLSFKVKGFYKIMLAKQKFLLATKNTDSQFSSKFDTFYLQFLYSYKDFLKHSMLQFKKIKFFKLANQRYFRKKAKLLPVKRLRPGRRTFKRFLSILKYLNNNDNKVYGHKKLRKINISSEANNKEILLDSGMTDLLLKMSTSTNDKFVNKLKLQENKKRPFENAEKTFLFDEISKEENRIAKKYKPLSPLNTMLYTLGSNPYFLGYSFSSKNNLLKLDAFSPSFLSKDFSEDYRSFLRNCSIFSKLTNFGGKVFGLKRFTAVNYSLNLKFFEEAGRPLFKGFLLKNTFLIKKPSSSFLGQRLIGRRKYNIPNFNPFHYCRTPLIRRAKKIFKKTIVSKIKFFRYYNCWLSNRKLAYRLTSSSKNNHFSPNFTMDLFLDVFLWRVGLFPTVAASANFIIHGGVSVNSHTITLCDYKLNEGDLISINKSLFGTLRFSLFSYRLLRSCARPFIQFHLTPLFIEACYTSLNFIILRSHFDSVMSNFNFSYKKGSSALQVFRHLSSPSVRTF